MLGCAAARAFTTSLLDGGASVGVDGPTPSLAVVMSEVRHLAQVRCISFRAPTN